MTLQSRSGACHWTGIFGKKSDTSSSEATSPPTLPCRGVLHELLLGQLQCSLIVDVLSPSYLLLCRSCSHSVLRRMLAPAPKQAFYFLFTMGN